MHVMEYCKPWLSYEDQLDLLISRGLAVTNRPKALEYLRRIGYYRLSGYWFPFRERSGLLGLLDEHECKPTKKKRKLGKHARLIGESKEEFVRHNKSKYGLPLAIWVACEVWDFGTMSRLYAGMREEDQDEISVKYGVHNGRIFATWLRSLNYLRNVCAHHSRLWNRNIVDQPRLSSVAEVAWVAPFESDVHLRARCFSAALHRPPSATGCQSQFELVRTHESAFADVSRSRPFGAESGGDGCTRRLGNAVVKSPDTFGN